MKFSSLAICLTSIISCTFVTAIPVLQESEDVNAISNPSDASSSSPSSSSNTRRAYLSKQFEDHTKNFILKAQERFELQAEKRKQHAKTKKAYSTPNKLPASSSSSSTKETVDLLAGASKRPTTSNILTSSPSFNAVERRLKSHHQPLHRFKRQGESGLNLDSLLDFVKEQTAKLDQVNNQLKSLTNSVSQGLDKLRKAANESVVDLQASASQVSREVMKALDTFNSGPKQGESLSDLATRAISGSNNNGDTSSMSTESTDSHQTGADETLDSLAKSVTTAYQQVQSVWSNLAQKVSQATSDQIELINNSNGQSSESVYNSQG